MTGARLRLDLLPTRLAVLRLPAERPVPEWTTGARDFLSVTRTPSELSIVADAAAVPKGVTADGPYLAFRVQGPLPLNLVGVFAALAGPLADAAVPIFPIATYDTDYLLVKATDASRACQVLRGAGHSVAGHPAGE